MISTASNQYFSLDEYLNGQEKEKRVLKADARTGKTEVVSEGDTSLFSESQSEMGKDQFLKLLVTQLQYQDPLSPQSDAEYAAQLAQFSALENEQNTSKAMMNLSEKMTEFMDGQKNSSNSVTNMSAVAMIGKQALVKKENFLFKNPEEPVTINAHTNGPKNVTVRITNGDGEEVWSEVVNLSKSESADFQVQWGGYDMNGLMQPPGTYKFEVLDSTGMNTAGYAFEKEKVTGVSYEEDEVMLEIQDVQYKMSDLIRVWHDEETEG